MTNTSTSFNTLFTSQQGQFPKILYFLPIILWLVVGGVLIASPKTITTSISNSIYGANTAVSTYALDLQEDINFMSTQVQGLQLFDLSKKEIISDNRQENFLLEKARRKLEKSPMAKSEGKLDNEELVFDSALNAMVVLPPKVEISLHNTDSLENQNPLSNYQNQYQEQEQEQEALRQQQIEQAKADNRQRRLALENNHIDYAAQAYEQGVIDQNRRYNQFHGTEDQPTSTRSSKKRSSSSSRTTSKTPTLSFNTATGQKNNFINSNNNSSRDKRTKSVNYSPTPSNQVSDNPTSEPLIATIDKADKVRSGDKVQIRIIQTGIYRGMTIPQDVILYGICRVNQNRIDISIPSISINGQLIRTNLIAYDMDGMRGIYVDGKFNDFTKDMVQEGLNAGNTLSGNGLGVRSPLGNVSLKLGRKANNRNRVHIPAAYQILLYDGTPEDVQQQQTSPAFSNH